MPITGRWIQSFYQALIIAYLMLATCSVNGSETSNFENLIKFQISQQNAGTSLNKVAKQAQVQMLFDYSLVQGLETNEVIGEYSAWDALQLLVEGTGLKPVRIDAAIFSVVPINNNSGSTKNMKKQQGLFGAIFAALFATGVPINAIAQDGEETSDDGFFQIEEIVVTARKREESLMDIPVSISVLNSNMLAEQNVITQGDLAELVPGFYYNQGEGAVEDRNAALPSIRGIGSTEIATNRSKVATFIDGMPILGSVGAINIGGASQVEIYSGPQSAAFGRSTFAGAINYVTIDPGAEIEGTVGLNWDDEGTRILNGSVGGPITDTLGFQISANIEDSESPDPDLYTYADGVEALTRTGENLSARLVFEPSDNFKAKLTFSRDTTDDGPRADFYASAESSKACYDSLEIFNVRGAVGPANNIGVDGVFDCELDVHSGTVLEQLNDIPRYLDNNPEEFAVVVANLRAEGATDIPGGLTVEEQARIVYDGYSVRHDDAGSESERDRVTAQFDYQFDDGSGIQLSLMKSEEELNRLWSRIEEQELQSLNYIDGVYNYAVEVTTMGPNAGQLTPNNRRDPSASPTTIDENYMELRWASPADERLRYVVGTSYYDYEYVLTEYQTGGYANIAAGTVDEFEALTGLTVEPTTIQSEITTNTAIFFNTSYDFTETITGSIEGRYASDKVGATAQAGSSATPVTRSITSKTFTPRLALNWSPSETTTYYAQYSIGVNPAGINADMLHEGRLSTLDDGIPVALDPAEPDTITFEPANANFDSSTYLTFDEEELVNYEIGFKGSAFDGRLSYTGAVYYMVWDSALQNINLDWDYVYADDNQAGDLVEGETDIYYVGETDNTTARVYTNTGESDTLGLELQASYRITNEWSINGNASIMQREFTSYCSEDDYLGFDNEIGVYAGLEESTSEAGNPCWVLDGKEVGNQPSLTMTLTPTYRTELGNGLRFTGSARIRHVGQYYTEFSNTTEKKALTTVSLNLGIAKDAWSATLSIDNLFDDRSLTPRGATTVARFNTLNDEFYDEAETQPKIPTEYQYTGPADVAWGSWRFNPNNGRSLGLRLNYNF